MDFTTPKTICAVCHGKGGFRKLKKDYLDTNWIDCGYCEGYGFVDDKSTTSEVKNNLLHNRFRSRLAIHLQILGTVKVCNLDYVKIEPFDRKTWSAFIKHVVKFSHHSDNVKVNVKQDFGCNDEGDIQVFWELGISTKELKDIESFIELVKFYNEMTGGSKYVKD